MLWRKIALSAALVATLAAAPLSQAEARGRGWWPFWPVLAAGAVVGTAAAVATAPFRYPYGYGYGYGYYAPPAAYYPPPAAYYPPGYGYAPYYYR